MVFCARPSLWRGFSVEAVRLRGVVLCWLEQYLFGVAELRFVAVWPIGGAEQRVDGRPVRRGRTVS